MYWLSDNSAERLLPLWGRYAREKDNVKAPELRAVLPSSAYVPLLPAQLPSMSRIAIVAVHASFRLNSTFKY